MPVNNVRLQRSRLTAALFTALLPLAGAAAAQTAPAAQQPASQANQNSQELDRVSVVGSRIKRVNIEGPAPVTVISREDFQREGLDTVADVLDTLTQNTTVSFTGDLAVTGFTPNAQVVNLRSLGPGYTLTLINGRRPAQYPQPYNRDNNVVNVGAIPTAMVERIEILTGGASAIYGSDAVAGVVNVVLRENYDGNSVRLQVGTTAEGGGDSVSLEYVGGRTTDRTSTVYGFQYRNQEPVFADQRDFLSDTRNGPLGPNFTNPGLALATLRFTPRTGGIGTSVYYPGQEVCDRFGYTTRTTAARGQYCGGFTQPGARSILNQTDSYAGRIYSTFNLTDSTELFGGVNVYQLNAKASAGTEFWSTSNDVFNRTQADTQINGYFDPQFGTAGEFTFLQRVFNPFELGGNEAASTMFDEKTYDLIAGARGTFFERFDWEAAASYGKYEYTQDRPRLLAQAVDNYFLGPVEGYRPAPGERAGTFIQVPIRRLNLARWNAPITPELYRSFSTRVINEGETTAGQANFTVTGDLFDLPAGSVGFAGVLEYARQTVDLRSDPRTDPLRPRDSQTVYNLVSSGRTVGDRDRMAVGAEFSIPLLTSLTFNAAARYDKYDDITAVDDAITYQLGLEYRPFDSLLLRSSYATSFRAPDMQLVYAEGAASFSNILDTYACRAGVGVADGRGPRTTAQCNAIGDPTIYSSQTTIRGNPQLEEESGKSFTAGFVWDVMDNLSFTADYYRIQLEDQSTQLTSGFLLANEANCRLGVRPDGRPFENSATSQFCQEVFARVIRQNGQTTAPITRINSEYINAALTDTSGIDATLKYQLDTDRMGRFNLDLGYSLMLTNKFKQFETDALVDFRDFLGNDTRSRARGTLGWSRDDWSVTLFGTRYGTVFSSAGTEGTNAAGGYFPRRLKPYMLYNLTVGKRFSPNLSTSFSIINLTNNQYRFDNSNTAYPFFEYYLGADPLGRRFQASIQYKF